MGDRPRIGITMRLELPTSRFYLGRDYSEAIAACGGTPLHLALIPEQGYISAAVDGLDGILLPGSNTDVDPHYYGEEPHHRLGVVIPEKDTTDQMVLAEAERRRIPVLGICYGMQAMNVFRGGSLIQDIESQVKGTFKHEQGIPAHRNSHGLKIDKRSFLMQLPAVKADAANVRVNSSHHQAVKRVGKNLRATAWALDGVIECIEDGRKGRFFVGVQWHPELSHGTNDLSYQLFNRFVAECRGR